MTTIDPAPPPLAATRRGFPDPYAIPTPEGAEGWREMYPYYNQFLEIRRDADSGRTWFRNGMHFPEPMPPFDMVTSDSAYMSTGVMNTRVFALPPALGIDVRVLNGYVYMSANGVEDPEEIGRRAQEFAVRVGHYYQNWTELYGKWEDKIKAVIASLAAITIPELGEYEPVENVLDGRGVTTSNDLLVAYQAILASADAAWNLHSELLNMGYAAYLNFLTLCRHHFAEITDQTVAKMVSGVDVLLFRPDDELQKLAALGIELDLVVALTSGRDAATVRGELAGTGNGKRWLDAYAESAGPWFHFSYGNGFYHHHRSWSDDPSFPMTMISEYIGRLQAGEDLSRPIGAVSAERDQIVERYRARIDEDERDGFDEALGLSRVVFPYVENHNCSPSSGPPSSFPGCVPRSARPRSSCTATAPPGWRRRSTSWPRSSGSTSCTPRSAHWPTGPANRRSPGWRRTSPPSASGPMWTSTPSPRPSPSWTASPRSRDSNPAGPPSTTWGCTRTRCPGA